MNSPMTDFVAQIRAEWINAGIIDPSAPHPEPSSTPKIDFLRQGRMERFKTLCPAQFRAPIDRAKIRNLAAWDQADAWEGSFPGIWLWSHETGMAKTRMLWRQFGRLFVEKRKVVLKISGQQLSEQYFEYHMEGKPREFYKWVTSHDVVMMDDLDKLDTEDARSGRMIRELWDALYESNKPVLVTANEGIDALERRIGMSGGRRMRELCREVKFGQ